MARGRALVELTHASSCGVPLCLRSKSLWGERPCKTFYLSGGTLSEAKFFSDEGFLKIAFKIKYWADKKYLL